MGWGGVGGCLMMLVYVGSWLGGVRWGGLGGGDGRRYSRGRQW